MWQQGKKELNFSYFWVVDWQVGELLFFCCFFGWKTLLKSLLHIWEALCKVAQSPVKMYPALLLAACWPPERKTENSVPKMEKFWHWWQSLQQKFCFALTTWQSTGRRVKQRHLLCFHSPFSRPKPKYRNENGYCKRPLRYRSVFSDVPI